MDITDLWKSWVLIPEGKVQEALRFLVWDYRNLFGDAMFAVEWRYVDNSWDKEYRVRPA